MNVLTPARSLADDGEVMDAQMKARSILIPRREMGRPERSRRSRCSCLGDSSYVNGMDWLPTAAPQ